MTVGEVQDRMSSYEITEWAAFYRVEADDQKREMDKMKNRRGRR